MMKLLVTGEESNRTGAMVPIPQYPLYSATVSELNAKLVSFFIKNILNLLVFLNESNFIIIIKLSYGTTVILFISSFANKSSQTLEYFYLYMF